MNNFLEINKNQAVLSDFDGTLVDTETAKGQLFHDGVAKAEAETGLDYPNKHNHVQGESTTDPMIKWVQAAAEDSPERIEREQFKAIYLEHWNGQQTTLYSSHKNLIPFKGAPGLVQQLNPERSALVSSNPTERLQLALRTLNWESNFGAVIGYDNPAVPAKKPDPSSYRVASQRLNFEPAHCVTIEDSLAGITSAVNAEIGKVLLVHRDEEPINQSLKQFVAEHQARVQVIASLTQIEIR